LLLKPVKQSKIIPNEAIFIDDFHEVCLS
jgi:hypothetical protein